MCRVGSAASTCRDSPRARDPAVTHSRAPFVLPPVPSESPQPLFPSESSLVPERLCLWQSWPSENCLRQYYLCRCDNRADSLAQHDALQISLYVHVEHDDRHLVVHTECDGG